MKTVADMREVAKRMNITGVSRLNKSELSAVIREGIEQAHSEALSENDLFNARKILAPTESIDRYDVVMANRIGGYLLQRNGGKLTARQYRRIGKKVRARRASR